VLLVSAALWIARGAGGPVHSAAAPPAAGATPATAAPATDIATLAVLPFTDMSREQDQEYFADGLAEEILNSLARLRGLRVTGRTSSFMFKGKSEDLRVVGRKLNVGAVLEGSVRKTGKRVRITAQLVNAADGFHLWSESYDRELNDIFAVQEEIARSVAEALKVTLLGSGAQGQSPRTESVEAYDAFLQAEYFFQRGDDVSLGKAFDGYQQAIRLYPGYAAAWAGLSEVYSAQAFLGARPEEEGVRSARDAAEHALTLDPDLASAHRALGLVRSGCRVPAGAGSRSQLCLGHRERWKAGLLPRPPGGVSRPSPRRGREGSSRSSPPAVHGGRRHGGRPAGRGGGGVREGPGAEP
jgi:TolB-like protein